jgi:23S rRNA pseudouridine1911/1915/1917 synthase
MSLQRITATSDQAGLTVAALLRLLLPGQSWSQVRRMVAARRVLIGGELCLDPARRLKEGQVIELRANPGSAPRQREQVAIRHLDEHVVVVEKPAAISTTRHPAERDWPRRRKQLEPALEDLVPPLIARAEGRPAKGSLPRLRKVHRLDKETSGLVVFARTVEAERALGRQFKAHTVTRRYLAVVPGSLSPQTIRTRLVRDRGDGRRGSTDRPGDGKEAVTHVEVVERLPSYTVLCCRLETGRTHQIRIHLAERGHPVCGDKVYAHRTDGTLFTDRSGAPRLALHAAELGFIHPATRAALHWTLPLPEDLEQWLARCRAKPSKRGVDGD